MNKNQHGFGAVGVIIVVLALVIVSLSGWLVWKRENSKSASKTDTVSTTQKSDPTNAKKASAETPKDAYLHVTEWGVKFKLSSDIADATYVMEGSGNNWVRLQTPKLIALAEQSKVCSAAKNSVSLNRAKVGDDHFGSPWTEEQLKAIGTKLGDYYYFEDAGQPCFGSEEDFQKEPTIQEKVNAERSLLSEVSKGVSAE